MDGAAEDEITEKAMPVSSHGYEIAFFLLGCFKDFGRRIAQGKLSRYLQAYFAQPIGSALKICAILFHLFRFGQLELVKVASDPAISDMDEQEMGMHQAGHLLDVGQEAGIGAAVFEGDQDFPIHESLFHPLCNLQD